jgi:vitamin B12 transporter
VISVPPAGNACGSGGDGSGGGTPTRFDDVSFALRPFHQDRALEIATTALEASFMPLGELELVVGYARHWLVRDDESSASYGSWSTGASYPLRDSLRLRAAAGRKIRMPSVRQLYDTLSGDPTLEAERAMTYEVGADYDGLALLALGLTVFRSDVENFIDRDPVTEEFANNQAYRFQGVELTAAAGLGERSDAQASYAWLDSADRGDGVLRDELQYRPRHKVALQVRHRLTPGPELTTTVQHVAGEYFFSRQGPPQTRSLDAYTLLNLRIEQPLFGRRVRLYAGADNLLDEYYEEAYGLPQAGRLVYGGISVELL